MLTVERDGEQVALLHPSRNYYSRGRLRAAPLRGFFEGEATSEVGRQDPGAAATCGRRCGPTSRRYDEFIAEADRRIARRPPAGPRAPRRRFLASVRADLQGVAVASLGDALPSATPSRSTSASTSTRS